MSCGVCGAACRQEWHRHAGRAGPWAVYVAALYHADPFFNPELTKPLDFCSARCSLEWHYPGGGRRTATG